MGRGACVLAGCVRSAQIECTIDQCEWDKYRIRGRKYAAHVSCHILIGLM